MTIQEGQLIMAAAEYDDGDAKRIQHFIKVHDLAVTIATGEKVGEDMLHVLSTATILHDIGIHEAERKYNNGSGHYQEIEGPAVARELMDKVGGYTPEVQERVCWLIAHHHHVNEICDLDHQILVEADYLVNIYEDGMSADAVRHVEERVFKTATGLRLLRAMYAGLLSHE